MDQKNTLEQVLVLIQSIAIERQGLEGGVSGVENSPIPYSISLLALEISQVLLP